METTEKHGFNISVKSFLTAIAVIAVLMVLTYTLTFFIPGGEYARVTDSAGNTVIDPAGGFTYVDGGLPLWKWLLSPFLVLSADGGGMMLAILAFLLVVGGAAAYIIRAKKSGKKCIGCPDGGSCHACSGTDKSGSCGGCGGSCHCHEENK